MSPKVLIIDNYDSFTYILKQYFGELGGNPEVFFHDKISISQIKKLKPTHIVLSPGPGTVENKKDVGIMFEVIEEFHKSTPILGVCLGHQAIGKYFGGEIVKTKRIMHGKRSRVNHNESLLFRGIPDEFEAMRYHSLALDVRCQISDFRFTAETNDKTIMAIEHVSLPIFGVQFHPESLGTKDGKQLLNNFLTCK